MIKHEIERKEHLVKLAKLKGLLNLTDKIFNLGSKSFDCYGCTEIYSIWVESYPTDFDENKAKINTAIFSLLWFFNDSPEDLNVLVDDLSPKAALSIEQYSSDINSSYRVLSINYHHPEMDRRNYTLFGKYGFIGKFFS